MGIYLIYLAICILGGIIAGELNNIKIELRYKNTLLKEQNEILLNKK